LLGGVTYVTINKGLPGLPGLEQYYARSKYWTAYAVQKVKWSAKRKKMREELKLDISKETPAHPAPLYPSQTAKVRPAEDAIGEERMLFGEVMKAVEKLNIKVGEIEDKVDEIKVSDKIDKPAKTVIQQKTEQAKTKPKPEPLKIQPAKTLPAKTVLKNTQPAKALPAKKEPAKTAPASAQPAKRPDPRTLSGRFGTEDPLKIAESILKRKRDEDDE
ncbi:hypothetical protein KY359_00555, partial [Candidatus Woesearchaeota archaeon]|nr:hypothetical protein [Candidatus Woesearchaeota archaeon]